MLPTRFDSKALKVDRKGTKKALDFLMNALRKRQIKKKKKNSN